MSSRLGEMAEMAPALVLVLIPVVGELDERRRMPGLLDVLVGDQECSAPPRCRRGGSPRGRACCSRSRETLRGRTRGPSYAGIPWRSGLIAQSIIAVSIGRQRACAWPILSRPMNGYALVRQHERVARIICDEQTASQAHWHAGIAIDALLRRTSCMFSASTAGRRRRADPTSTPMTFASL